jgi:transcription antitermination factor NusG
MSLERSGQENKVKAIETEIAENGRLCSLSLLRKSSYSKRGKKKNRQSLFSGYVMIEANLLVKFHIIKSITSVIGFF